MVRTLFVEFIFELESFPFHLRIEFLFCPFCVVINFFKKFQLNSSVLTLSQFFRYVYIRCAEHICLNAGIVFEISSIKLRYSSGIEGNPVVFYRLMPGSTAQTNKFHTFYLQQRPDNGDTWADIKVNHPLDYESIKEYNLTIRVEVSTKNPNFYDFIFVLILIRLK